MGEPSLSGRRVRDVLTASDIQLTGGAAERCDTWVDDAGVATYSYSLIWGGTTQYGPLGGHAFYVWGVEPGLGPALQAGHRVFGAGVYGGGSALIDVEVVVADAHSVALRSAHGLVGPDTYAWGVGTRLAFQFRVFGRTIER